MAKDAKRYGANLQQMNPKRSKPSNPTEDMPDSEEDLGRSMSEQILATAKETHKRSNAAVAIFGKAVDERKQRLTAFLNERTYTMTRQEKQLKASFLKVLIRSYPTTLPKTTTNEPLIPDDKLGTTPTACTVYNIAKSCITLSRKLLGYYDQICQHIAAAEGVLRMEPGAEADLQTLQRVLDNQRKKVKVELEQLLDKSGKSTKEQHRTKICVADSDLWTQFAMPSRICGKAGREKKREGWAIITKQIQKGVQRIVECLPEDNSV